MKKVTKENLDEFYKPNQSTFRSWAIINEKIIHFCNYSTIKQFNFIFDEDAERLWRHFKLDCDSIFQKFKTYLTDDQYNILMVTIFINDFELYAL